MKCTSDTKWKYLRESKTKYFNSARNTSLDQYLNSIFPENHFEYSSSIRKDELPENVRARRFVCDAICKELKIVVEFDGLNHYTDTQVVLNDIERDRWFEFLGYHVVRIPYWIQLSKDVIHDLFGVEVSEPYCELNYSFYDPEHEKVNFNATPGNWCELGRKRFIDEFNKFSFNVRLQIFKDLLECAKHVDDSLITTIMPKEIFYRLNIDYVLKTLSSEDHEIVTHKLLSRYDAEVF